MDQEVKEVFVINVQNTVYVMEDGKVRDKVREFDHYPTPEEIRDALTKYKDSFGYGVTVYARVEKMYRF